MGSMHYCSFCVGVQLGGGLQVGLIYYSSFSAGVPNNMRRSEMNALVGVPKVRKQSRFSTTAVLVLESLKFMRQSVD